MTTKTRGEEIFSEYLDSLGLSFDYEPPLGQRPPDFLVHSPCGDVLCEVKDLGANADDRAEIKAARAGHTTAGFRAMPFDRIGQRIKKASQTLREFKGRYPSLVVLCDPLVVAFLGDFTLVGAMHRLLTPTLNTTVSAVAILEYVSAHQSRLDEALSTQDFGVGSDRARKVATFVNQLAEEHPEWFDQVPRLHVFRNAYAAVPWPTEALNGPHDLLWTEGAPS